MNLEQTIRFNYKFSNLSALIMVLVAICVTAVLCYLAYENPDVRFSRQISRLISPQAPALIYLGLAFFSLITTVFSLVFAFKSFNAINYIELGPEGAFVTNASLSMSPMTIPYNSITNIQVVNVRNQKLAVITSSIGEARLLEQFFESPGDFNSFISALQQRTRQ